MRKIKYLIMLLVIAIMATGCVKFNANMDIKKDKSMEFSIIYAFDKSIFGEENLLKKEDMSEVEKQGFTIKDYQDGNMVGFTMTKKIANIDDISTDKDVEFDISGMMGNTSDNQYMFKVVKGDNKNTYYAKFKFDANESNLNDDSDEEYPDEVETTGSTTLTLDDNENIDYSSMMSGMDLSFNVTLPNSALSSNATKKENNNKKLSWSLDASNEQYIEFSFEIDNNASSDSNILLYIGIIAAVIVVIAVILVLVLKKKKNNPVNPSPEVKETI